MVKETHNDPMAKAIDIVQRYRDRGMVMPREWREHHLDPVKAEVSIIVGVMKSSIV